MRLTIIFLLLSVIAFSQPTYFGSASDPADNAVGNSGTMTVTPPGSMTAGDLVILFAQTGNQDIDGDSIQIVTAGGQTWHAESYYGGVGSPPYMRIFWCRYNGTWGANPSVGFYGFAVSINSVVMHVFRPTVVSNNWAIGASYFTVNSFSNAVAPYTVSITGLTPTRNNNVIIACWHSGNDHSWGTLAGSGWSVLGSAQYRNIAGSDQSLTFAYQIQGAAAASNNVSKNASATVLGTNIIFYFYEYSASPFRIIEN